MLKNKFTRAAVFFLIAFGVPVVIGALMNDLNQGVQTGVITGTIFAVVSQFFEPKDRVTQ